MSEITEDLKEFMSKIEDNLKADINRLKPKPRQSSKTKQIEQLQAELDECIENKAILEETLATMSPTKIEIIEQKIEPNPTIEETIATPTQYQSIRKKALLRKDEILSELKEIIKAESMKISKCIELNSFSLITDFNVRHFLYLFLITENITPAIRILVPGIQRLYDKLHKSYDSLSLDKYNRFKLHDNKSSGSWDKYSHIVGHELATNVLETALLDANFPISKHKSLKFELGLWQPSGIQYPKLPPYSMFEEGQRFIACQIDFIDKMFLLERDARAEITSLKAEIIDSRAELGLGLKTRRKQTKKRNRTQHKKRNRKQRTNKKLRKQRTRTQRREK